MSHLISSFLCIPFYFFIPFSSPTCLHLSFLLFPLSFLFDVLLSHLITPSLLSSPIFFCIYLFTLHLLSSLLLSFLSSMLFLLASFSLSSFPSPRIHHCLLCRSWKVHAQCSEKDHSGYCLKDSEASDREVERIRCGLGGGRSFRDETLVVFEIAHLLFTKVHCNCVHSVHTSFCSVHLCGLVLHLTLSA